MDGKVLTVSLQIPAPAAALIPGHPPIPNHHVVWVDEPTFVDLHTSEFVNPTNIVMLAINAEVGAFAFDFEILEAPPDLQSYDEAAFVLEDGGGAISFTVTDPESVGETVTLEFTADGALRPTILTFHIEPPLEPTE